MYKIDLTEFPEEQVANYDLDDPLAYDGKDVIEDDDEDKEPVFAKRLTEGVSWFDKVSVTEDEIGKERNIQTLTKFDDLSWLKENIGEYNIPKIIGFSLWYNVDAENFRGIHLYY